MDKKWFLFVDFWMCFLFIWRALKERVGKEKREIQNGVLKLYVLKPF